MEAVICEGQGLAPCPCCGAEFDLTTGLWILPNGKFYIMCPDCEADTADLPSLEEVIAAWDNGNIEKPLSRIPRFHPEALSQAANA